MCGTVIFSLEDAQGSNCICILVVFVFVFIFYQYDLQKKAISHDPPPPPDMVGQASQALQEGGGAVYLL